MSIVIGLATAFGAAVCFFLIGAQYQQQHVIDVDVDAFGWVSLMGKSALAGFVIGVGISRIANIGVGQAFAWSFGLVAAISAFMLMRLSPDHVPYIDREYMTVEVEIKCPKDWNPDYKAFSESPSFDCPGSTSYTDWSKAVMDGDGRWVVPAACELLSSRETRIARTNIDGTHPLRFNIPLPPVPTAKNAEWGSWTSSEFVDGTGEGFSVRARIWSRALAEKPGPSEADAKLEARQAAFHALSPADPLSRWLDLYEPSEWIQNDPTREPSLAVIQTKVAEFPAILRSDDRLLVRRAIEAISKMKAVPPELTPDLIIGGRQTTIAFIRYARSKARPGLRDLKAEQDAYWFFRNWDEGAMERLGLDTAATKQRHEALEAIVNEVKDEEASYLAELATAARARL